MKMWHRRGIMVAVVCVVGVAIAWIAQAYFQHISQQMYEECAAHLEEVYSQVNRSFISFLEETWSNLGD